MKIALLGYGKMGQTIESLIMSGGIHSVNLKLTSAVTIDQAQDALKHCDVAIDFSVPEAVMPNAITCINQKIPLVIGTTGWYDQLEEVRQLCLKNNGSIVYGSNFSIGVNIFFELNAKLAMMMQARPEYQPAIEEVHHAQKKDAPSGTALALAREIMKWNKAKGKWVNGKSGKPDELVISSRREGTVAGLHRITYQSAVDRIEIVHEAFSREGFAAGALTAAAWIAARQGFFEFHDVLFKADGTIK